MGTFKEEILVYIIDYLDLHSRIGKEEFNDEYYDNSHSTPGLIRMIKTGRTLHSNESQFYITLTSKDSFIGKYVTFGRIVQGFKSIKQIEEVETYLQTPKKIVKVEKSGEYII
jgi:cyclophilin family peptidyl-prolyl cis-trans isomerase